MMWATLEQARQDWADAQHLPDPVLVQLLEDSTEACREFAPDLPVDSPVPPGYGRAVVLQARELWSAAQRDGDVIGGDDFPVRVRPLIASVRQLLRPRRGKPRLG